MLPFGGLAAQETDSLRRVIIPRSLEKYISVVPEKNNGQHMMTSIGESIS